MLLSRSSVTLFNATQSVLRRARNYHSADPTEHIVHELSRFRGAPSFREAIQKGYINPKTLASFNTYETALVIKELLTKEHSERALAYLEKGCFTFEALMKSKPAVRESYIKKVLCNPDASSSAKFTTLDKHETSMHKFDLDRELAHYTRGNSPSCT